MAPRIQHKISRSAYSEKSRNPGIRQLG